MEMMNVGYVFAVCIALMLAARDWAGTQAVDSYLLVFRNWQGWKMASKKNRFFRFFKNL